MALRKTFTSLQSVQATNAYHKIRDVNGDKNNIRFTVESFYDQAARDNNKEPLEYRSFEIPTPNTDLFPAMYNHLKTLPEFTGAIDV